MSDKLVDALPFQLRFCLLMRILVYFILVE